jgi:hypothetical protein
MAQGPDIQAVIHRLYEECLFHETSSAEPSRRGYKTGKIPLPRVRRRFL